jgi:hypothetical protein
MRGRYEGAEIVDVPGRQARRVEDAQAIATASVVRSHGREVGMASRGMNLPYSGLALWTPTTK